MQQTPEDRTKGEGGGACHQMLLASIHGPEDLVCRKPVVLAHPEELFRPQSEKIKLDAARVCAVLLLEQPGDFWLSLLHHTYDGFLWAGADPWHQHEIRGPATLLDMAVLQEQTELARLLALRGVSMHLWTHIHQFMIQFYRKDIFESLVAVLGTGRFKHECEAAINCSSFKEEMFKEEIVQEAIRAGYVDLASRIAAVETELRPQGLCLFRLGQLGVDMMYLMQRPKALEAFILAGHASEEFCFDRPLRIQVMPSNWTFQNAWPWEVAILCGFADAALQMFEAEGYGWSDGQSMTLQDWLWAASSNSSMAVGWYEGCFPVDVSQEPISIDSSLRAPSLVIQRALSCAAARYSTVLLERLGNSTPLMHYVLSFIINVPSILFKLAEVRPPACDGIISETLTAASQQGMDDKNANLGHQNAFAAEQSQQSLVEDDSHIQKEAEDNTTLLQTIQLSRTELPTVLSGDNVVLFRLTRHARSPQVISIFNDSELLSNCRRRVLEAGCEISPLWASGAKLLVPLTESQVEELEQSGIELMDSHVVALREDEEVIRQALKSVRNKDRPRLSLEHGSNDAEMEQPAGRMGDDDMAEDVDIVQVYSLSTDSNLGFPEYLGAGSS